MEAGGNARDLVAVIVRYLWFAVAVWVPIMLWVWERHVGERLHEHAVERALLRRLMRGASAAVVVVSLTLGAIVLWSGRPTMCTRLFAFEGRGDVANHVVVLGSWLLLWWLWAGGGGTRVAQVATALARASGASRQYSPGVVNVTATACFLLLVTLQVVLEPLVPPDPLCAS